MLHHIPTPIFKVTIFLIYISVAIWTVLFYCKISWSAVLYVNRIPSFHDGWWWKTKDLLDCQSFIQAWCDLSIMRGASKTSERHLTKNRLTAPEYITTATVNLTLSCFFLYSSAWHLGVILFITFTSHGIYVNYEMIIREEVVVDYFKVYTPLTIFSGIVDINDVSGVGSTTVFRWLVVITQVLIF